MELVQLDAFVRVGALTTVLLIAWLLFRRSREVGTPAALFAPLAICLSGFVIGNTPAPLLRPSGFPGMIAHLVSGYTVVFLWWFCLSCFDSRFRIRGGVLMVGLTWAALASADRGFLGSAAADKGLSYVLVGMGFGIVGHLIWRLVAEREDDLIQRRRDARIMAAVLLGGQLLIDLSADAILGAAWRPLAFAMFQNVAILGFGLWLASKVLAVRPDAFSFAGTPDTASSGAGGSAENSGTGADSILRRRLLTLIETERVFLDPELTFAAFVQRMGAPEREVRKLVNHELGFDHFRTFLNHHRVAEARRLLADPGRAEDKLIAIGLDSGFASIPSFNRVFRATESCSPGEYRAKALAERQRR